jgi:hypothetical protein
VAPILNMAKSANPVIETTHDFTQEEKRSFAGEDKSYIYKKRVGSRSIIEFMYVLVSLTKEGNQ